MYFSLPPAPLSFPRQLTRSRLIISKLLAYSMSIVELAVGALLVAGFILPPTAWAAVGLNTLLLFAVSIGLWRGLKIANCGRFGVFWPRPLGVQTFVEDAVMLGLSVLVLLQASRADY